MGISALSTEWKLARHISRAVKTFNSSIYTVLGGIHAYADPVGVITENSIDIVCIGEGKFVL